MLQLHGIGLSVSSEARGKYFTSTVKLVLQSSIRVAFDFLIRMYVCLTSPLFSFIM